VSQRDPRSIDAIRAALAAATGPKLVRLVRELESDERAGVQALVRAADARRQRSVTEARRLAGLYQLEAELRAQGLMVVAGVDEVGRGALAGPLSAGACVLPATPRIPGLDDSKRLTPQRREELALVIREVAVCWSVGHVQAEEIDDMGVAAALRRAMGRALAGLEFAAEHVIVDGLPVGISANETAVVKGDSKVAAIAAASILAKVTRDKIMVELSPEFSVYRFDENKGYGTLDHLEAISQHGLSPYHRRSFCPGGGTGTLF
jgi:ribonuclease HII